MAKKDHPKSNHNAGQQPNPSADGQTVNRASDSNTAHALTGEEYFPVGTIVKLVKVNDKVVDGEVLAFDPLKKMLILKRAATSKKPGLNDFQIINFEMVKNVEVVSEPSEVRSPIKHSEISVSEARLKTNLARRKKFAKAFKQGITEDGINVFRAVSKTLEEIDWKDKNIVVMGKVNISPPYKPENVKGNADTAVQHVRKIVEKFHEEQRTLAEKASASNEKTQGNSNSQGTGQSGTASPSPLTSTPTPPSSNSSQAGTPTTGQPAPAPAPPTNNNNNNQRRNNDTAEGRRPNKSKNYKGGSTGGGGGPQTPKPMYFMH